MPTVQTPALKSAPKLAIVVSRFNEEVTGKLLEGALARLKEFFADADPVIVWVPGAVEIPLIAQQLAKSQAYDAIVALGAVIRGETSHYDYVCKQVSDGCQQVSMQYALPVIFGVLTTDNEDQAFDRVGGAHGHKGKDAIDAAFEMVALMRQLA